MSKAIAEAHKGGTMKAELAKATKETGIERAEPLNVGAMLTAIIDKGITLESVQVVGELMKFKEHEEARSAEKAFAQAFIALQSEIHKVKAAKEVKTKMGATLYNYAPFEDIMGQVSPLLKAHGFTVTFSTDYQVGPPCRLVKSCTLQHVGGHKQTNSFAVRIPNIQNCSDAQNDGGASTFAKRYVLCDALNIVIGADNDARFDDARAEGGPITEAQARRIEERCEYLKIDRETFLKYAQAVDFEMIPASMHDELVRLLDKKEAKLKAASDKVPT